MSKILISIKPKYVDEILLGNKKYEYRKTKPKRDNINKIIIYSTYPIMKVVAEVEIKKIIVDEPNIIWNKTKKQSGTTKKFFDEYFKNKKKAVAFELGKIKVYSNHMTLSDFDIKYAPQSFIYLE